MTDAVRLLQLVCGLLWLVPVAFLSPRAWRAVHGRASTIDLLRMPMMMVALSQVLFSVRWMLWPHSLPTMQSDELLFWTGAYVLSAIAAAGTIYAHWLTRT